MPGMLPGRAIFSTIAGFVEVGESLEDAARREAREEVGIEVQELVYAASQAWPFPAGLMIGFLAKAASLAFKVDGDEVAEARWLSRPEIKERYFNLETTPLRMDAIDASLLRAWAYGDSDGA